MPLKTIFLVNGVRTTKCPHTDEVASLLHTIHQNQFHEMIKGKSESTKRHLESKGELVHDLRVGKQKASTTKEETDKWH